jgi:hypothetical protein
VIASPRMTLWLACVVAVLLSIAGCAERLPWRAAEILRDLEPELRRFDGERGELTDVDILAWQIQKDDSRSFVVEEAFLWGRGQGDGGRNYWVLLHAYRHPNDENVWHRSVAFVEPAAENSAPHTRLGYRRFDAPPSGAEICSFIDHVRPIAPVVGFRRVSGKRRDHVWQRVTGQDPPCEFLKP